MMFYTNVHEASQLNETVQSTHITESDFSFPSVQVSHILQIQGQPYVSAP